MCILTTLNQGLRNGGGIGDILRAPSSTVSFLFNIILYSSPIKKHSLPFTIRRLGSSVCGKSHLRFAVLLYRHYYRFEPDIWCDY